MTETTIDPNLAIALLIGKHVRYLATVLLDESLGRLREGHIVIAKVPVVALCATMIRHPHVGRIATSFNTHIVLLFG